MWVEQKLNQMCWVVACVTNIHLLLQLDLFHYFSVIMVGNGHFISTWDFGAQIHVGSPWIRNDERRLDILGRGNISGIS